MTLLFSLAQPSGPQWQFPTNPTFFGTLYKYLCTPVNTEATSPWDGLSLSSSKFLIWATTGVATYSPCLLDDSSGIWHQTSIWDMGIPSSSSVSLIRHNLRISVIINCMVYFSVFLYSYHSVLPQNKLIFEFRNSEILAPHWLAGWLAGSSLADV